jgi:hypothetical protein
MAITKLKTINAALHMVGEPSITSLEATSARALVTLEEWEFALDQLLRSAFWNFARKRTTLVVQSPAPDFGWDFRYALPSDYVQMFKLNGEEPGEPGEWWVIESGYLLTDESEANVEYTARPDDAATPVTGTFTTAELLARMDPNAVQALVTGLAVKLATPLNKDEAALMFQLEQLHARHLSAAITDNANEAKRPRRDPALESSFVVARMWGRLG